MTANKQGRRRQQPQQQQEEQQEQTQKCDKKMCCKLRYKKNIILCSAPAHTTIHNPYGIASVRSSAIQLRRLPTSGLPHERPRATRALGAVPNRRPSDPAPKNSSESFLDGIRVVHGRLHEHSPTPPF